MRIPKENILLIRQIRKRRPLPPLSNLLLAHPRQHPILLPIQTIIPPPQHQHHKAQHPQRNHNADLPTNIPRRLFTLKRLRAQDVPHRKAHKRQGVGRHLLAVARHVARVPRQQQHKRRAERAGQKTGA